MGVLQALEAIKLIAAGGVDGTIEKMVAVAPSLLLFTGIETAPFRSMRMRGRKKDCFACSASSTLTLETLSTSIDYVSFCGVIPPVQALPPGQRISAKEYRSELSRTSGPGRHLLLDVRERENFDIGSIPGALNVPITQVMQNLRDENEGQENWLEWLPADLRHNAPIYVICRVGNDSQVVARRLKDMGLDRKGERFIGDIKGGMKAWKEEIDPTMPFI
jgi:adenylyltransferase and sulfurtransferase